MSCLGHEVTVALDWEIFCALWAGLFACQSSNNINYRKLSLKWNFRAFPSQFSYHRDAFPGPFLVPEVSPCHLKSDHRFTRPFKPCIWSITRFYLYFLRSCPGISVPPHLPCGWLSPSPGTAIFSLRLLLFPPSLGTAS